MLALTRIFLHNWRDMHHHLLDVGESGSPASPSQEHWAAVVSGIQLVLGGNLAHLPPSSPIHQTGYVVLECTDKQHDAAMTVGVCVETCDTMISAYTFFLIPAPLDPDLFAPNEQPLSRHELKQMLYSLHDVQTYEQIDEYRANVLVWLGNIPYRFFDLFNRAASLQPPSDIHQFIKEWILEPQPLDLSTFQPTIEYYLQLRDIVTRLEEQIELLQTIVAWQDRVVQLRQEHATYVVLLALLQVKMAEHQLPTISERYQERDSQLTHAISERTDCQTSLEETQEELWNLELDLRKTSVKRRYDELQRKIKQSTSDATIIHARWLTLIHDLKREEAVLQALLEEEKQDRLLLSFRGVDCGFSDEEKNMVRACLERISVLSQERPPTRAFAPLLDATIPVLDAALFRAHDVQSSLRNRMKELRSQVHTLEQELHHIREGGRGYPPEIERVCDLLTHVIGERPPLLCEVLDVPDERWQVAVEATLGLHRFTILVQPKYIEVAMQVMSRARVNESLYNVGIIDITNTLHHESTAAHGSLATFVRPHFPALHPYIRMLLGHVIACERVEDLRYYRHAVTPDGIVSHDWTVRILPPDSYEPWFVGERAYQSQIEHRERQQHELREELGRIINQTEVVGTRITRLRRVRDLSSIRQRLDAPLDDRPLRELIADYVAQQRSLDMSGVEALNQEVKRLRERLAQDHATESQLTKHIAEWEGQKSRFEEELRRADTHLSAMQQYFEEMCGHYPGMEERAQTLLSSYLPHGQATDDSGYEEAIQQVSYAVGDFENQLAEGLRQLTQATSIYNTRYGFGADIGNPDDERYRNEEERIATTDVPYYHEQFEHAKRQTQHAVVEQVLIPLHEHIIIAQQQLERMNEMFARIDLYGERYQFSYQMNEEMQEFAFLVQEAPSLRLDISVPNASHVSSAPQGSGVSRSEVSAAFASQFHLLCEALITPAPHLDQRTYRQPAHVLDYRDYLAYDIERTRPDGTVTHLGSWMRLPSEGETYIPVYVVIASAFAQLYQVSEQHDHPSLRLVVLHHGFFALESERVHMLCLLFSNLGLQLLTPGATVLSPPVPAGRHNDRRS
jgi:hypothetical protein